MEWHRLLDAGDVHSRQSSVCVTPSALALHALPHVQIRRDAHQPAGSSGLAFRGDATRQLQLHGTRACPETARQRSG